MEDNKKCPDCGCILRQTVLDEQSHDGLIVRCKNNHKWKWSMVRPAASSLYYETLQSTLGRREA